MRIDIPHNIVFLDTQESTLHVPFLKKALEKAPHRRDRRCGIHRTHASGSTEHRPEEVLGVRAWHLCHSWFRMGPGRRLQETSQKRGKFTEYLMNLNIFQILHNKKRGRIEIVLNYWKQTKQDNYEWGFIQKGTQLWYTAWLIREWHYIIIIYW